MMRTTSRWPALGARGAALPALLLAAAALNCGGGGATTTETDPDEPELVDGAATDPDAPTEASAPLSPQAPRDAGADRSDSGAPADASPDAEGGPADVLDGSTEDAGSDAGDAEPPPPPPPPPPGPLSASYVDFDINHVLVTGQSNSVANGGTPPLSTTQPYGNLRFDTGVMPMKTCDGNGCRAYDTPASFLPLVEGDRFFNYAVETPAAGIANEATRLAFDRYEFGARAGYPTKHDVLVSVHGRSGNTYWCLRKNGCNYKPGYLASFDQAMMEVASAKALSQALGKSYVVRAVTSVHGESDHYSYGTNTQEFPLVGTDGTPGKIKDYADALLEWQSDYESSIQAVTGQAQPVPLLISGISGWNDVRYSKVAQMQLDAHVRSNGKVLLVTPGYPLSVKNDCLHFDAAGERRLGEYFAKVYAKVVFGGESWEPVRPKSVELAGTTLTVRYHVPSPPLVLDTARVSNPGSFGFELVDGTASPPTITSVVVSAPDTVTLTLSKVPAGANKRLRYAQNQTPSTCIGPGTVYAGGARGNVRDSDATPSQHGYELFNWGVSFDMIVP